MEGVLLLAVYLICAIAFFFCRQISPVFRTSEIPNNRPN